MAHIKKMVMQGFKSFARKTEVPFDRGINVIVGPNGSGKSNISDALCFVLGRLSVKSMRAAKAKNLIFMGSKYIKPAREASVEMVFDNSDRTFTIDADEISLYRAVKAKGSSVYKINGETKTRAEMIELLAHAGIDPYGFNLILQGEIQSIVRMHSEERRKVIEEVAGISIYESRKEKSLKELEKTEERLKEISTVLRERGSYLNNLEKEKSQAERYQELKVLVSKLKASILKKKLDEKEKEMAGLVKAIDEKAEQCDKKRVKVTELQQKLDALSEEITKINKHIQQATGLEQGRLREEITNVRAQLEGMRVRKESYENREKEIQRRIEEMLRAIPALQNEIKELREESPKVAKKAEELRKKKEALTKIEQDRKRLLTLKTELQGLRERIADKEKQLSRTSAEGESIVRRIEEIGKDLQFENESTCAAKIEEIRAALQKNRAELDSLHEKELGAQRTISVSESVIREAEKIKKQVEKLDLCPLCQSKITQEHIGHVFKDSDDKISLSLKEAEEAKKILEGVGVERAKLREAISEGEKGASRLERELLTHKTILERSEQLKQAVAYEKTLKAEVEELRAKLVSLEPKTEGMHELETQYQSIMHDIEEISSRTSEDVDTTLLYKERELEKMQSIIQQNKEDLEEMKVKISELAGSVADREKVLEEKEEQEKKLTERFNKMFKDRDAMQRQIQENTLKVNDLQNEVRQIEDQMNYLKIGRAKIDGEKEALQVDMVDFKDVEIIQGSLQNLDERLRKTQQTLETIGSINMRALEVYDQVKKEYDLVKEKVETLDKEKVEILKIIEEIDKKKYKTFIKTFKSINELFTRNFSKLTTKNATAMLEIENRENVFEGGVNIVVKMGKGKNFDVTSLSGGEQTMVALSLLFAIQEYRPYQFYILDEIDAALDKRNSERLAALLAQYMKTGQYIVITHNDAIIMNSNLLYGVSMHDGVSKVLSIDMNERDLKAAVSAPSPSGSSEVSATDSSEVSAPEKEVLEEPLVEMPDVSEDSEVDNRKE